MNVIEQHVPEGIRYISEWTEYTLPKGHCIIDKEICGCGFTEYCISPFNPNDTILCSPRIVLLENKIDQHSADPNLFYFRSEFLKKEYDKLPKKFGEDDTSGLMEYYSRVINTHVLNCRTSGLPVRILCTYDSFHTVLDILSDRICQFNIIVDEFQSIFLDSFFKSSIENDFYNILQSVPNVAYLSATPMMEKYLGKLDGFKDLPYYKMIWPESKITRALIKEKWTSNLSREILGVIKLYKEKSLNRPWKDINGTAVFSNEAVIYVNSVAMIKRLITSATLQPSEVNIICSSSDKNNIKLVKSIRKGDPNLIGEFIIGKIPKKGEQHKMFTFCTRTAYLGADFYSTSAVTYVLSDANVKSLVLDISLDLPQILGRQRLLENPWKNEAVVFYKTLSKDHPTITKEDFDNYTLSKKNSSYEFLSKFSGLTQDCTTRLNRTLAANKSNIEFYIGFDYQGNLVYNPFLELAEERAWELSQEDYKTNISVLQTMTDIRYSSVQKYNTSTDERAQILIDKIKSLRQFDLKFKLFCEFMAKYQSEDPDLVERVRVYYRGTEMDNLYSHFGIDVCRAVGYKTADLTRRLQYELSVDLLASTIFGTFKIGEKYLSKDIKKIIQSIYNRLGLSQTPKSTDILTYYEVKDIQLTDPNTGKRSRGYQLISIK